MSVVVNEFEVVPDTGAPSQQPPPDAADIPVAEHAALDHEIERVMRLRLDRLLRLHAS
jgi:hypothetical protein